MKLGLMLGYSGKKIEIPMDLIKHIESIGYDSVWTAEAYGSDAVSPAAWILAQTQKIKVGTAIMQMPGRTPALAAMTAMTLAQLSNDRFIVGLGASGPQVVEGWHGVPYGKPVTRLKEYITIMREIFARQGPVTFSGKEYSLPNKQEGTTGLGKPLKSILHAANIPIYAANITPRGVQAAAQVADGFFPVWMDPDQYDVFSPAIEKGFAESTTPDKSLETFDIAPFVAVSLDKDTKTAINNLKMFMALYIGGMGAKTKNFYKDYATALGFGEEAQRVQELYLANEKLLAIDAVPDDLVDACYLVGSKERIRERAQRWKHACEKKHVSTMLLNLTGSLEAQKEAATLMADIFIES